MRSAYGTDVGKKRKNNEDALYVCDDESSINYFIVADGMGGHNAGEVASKNAIKEVAEFLNIQNEISQDTVLKAIEKANADIYEMSKTDKKLNGMGTTIVLAVADDENILIAHVGDSRAYLISDNNITRLTTDHSWVQELINSGTLTQSEAKDHPQKNVITRAIGISGDVKTDLLLRGWKEKDILLLCTDGLNTLVEDNEILEIIKNSSDLDKMVFKLIDLANTRGGNDNITVVLVENSASEGNR